MSRHLSRRLLASRPVRARLALATAALVLIAAGPALDAVARSSPGRLRQDAEAVREAGATGVTARARDAAGRDTTARAGVADLAAGGPVPYQAYYRIGSDTKTFTAVAVLGLVGEGRLGLDDTVEEWLPGLVRGNGHDGARVTVRNLLQHTSGLADYADILYEEHPELLTPEGYRADRFRFRTPEERVALALTRPPLWLPDPADPAGETRFSYSNTNYVLAGMIVERVTGRPWEQEVHDRIIEPLGLRHTLTTGTSAYVPEPTATAYQRFPGRDDLTDTTVLVDGGADGAIVSTTADMNTFLRALMDGRLLGPAELAEMRRTVPAPDFSGRPGTRYGLGIAWRPAPGCPGGLWFHGGTSFGTVSETGVTADGSASAAAAVFTLDFADEAAQRARAEATTDLVEHAVCGTS